MRNLILTTTYKNAADRIGKQSELENVLSGVYWALRNNAEDFPLIPGYKTLRMVKTDAVRDIPSLRVVFKIRSETEVKVEWIEIADTEEFQGPPLM